MPRVVRPAVAPTFLWLFMASAVLSNRPTFAAEDVKAPAGPVAKIVLRADGFAPVDIEQLIARPIVEACVGLDGVASITAVSGNSLVEIYLESDPKVTEEELSRAVLRKLPALDSGNLPAGVIIKAYEMLPEFVQPLPPEQADRASVCIDVKRDAAALYGIETSAIMKMIRKESPREDEPATQKSVDALLRLTVSTPDGKEVPLSELANIKLEKIPSRRIYRWPHAEHDGASATKHAEPGVGADSR